MPRVYEDIVKVVNDHRERNNLTFLITAAPVELAATVASELDMSGAIGTVADKAAAHGLDLAECHAYSDSINDLPLLESVGYPHAVKPDRELRRIASARGWPIHELRTKRKALGRNPSRPRRRRVVRVRGGLGDVAGAGKRR